MKREMNSSTKNNQTINDPVCGMAVVPGIKEITTNIDGKIYYFCSESCRKSFRDNPEKFLEPRPTKKKGLWGRYLERLRKATGGKSMKCH